MSGRAITSAHARKRATIRAVSVTCRRHIRRGVAGRWLPAALVLLGMTHALAAPPAAASALAAAVAPIVVPFDLDHDTIIVHAMIAGRGPFDVMLDTGVDPSVVDLATARRIGLTIATHGEVGSGGGTDRNIGYATHLPDVRIGGLAQATVDAAAVDLSAVSAALGRPIAAVLGYSLLKKRVVEIDYPGRVVRFHARSSPTRPDDARHATLRFAYRDDILARGVTLDGHAVVANIDTGSNSTFQVAPAAVERLGLAQDAAQAAPTRSTGFNGSSEHRRGEVATLRIGSFAIERPTVVFLGRGTGHDGESWDIRIGNGFFRDYVLTVDFRRHVVLLERP